MTRSDFAALSDVELQVTADRHRYHLRKAWENGYSGKLEDVLLLALAHCEAENRGMTLHPLPPEGWQRLFDPDTL